MISFTTFLLTLLALFNLSLSAHEDVFVPPVLYPRFNTVWIVGQYHNVTWDTDDAPVHISNKIGQVYLAANYIIDMDHPLATGFNILDGRVVIHVPKVTPGSHYSIVLMGDSGNYSPQFTIRSH
ncbi:uncharacterized protein EDB91DRAFT_573494 [Suillus paluster]|uniref:uncharacterized protein n=1 Tax=Suillus paluster TaxID=48578 RepID=UPI001B87E151|nr:uncharacterized protein EDB91DRAFT_573494 [Suillus paluster]KAG1734861.1 hypothetical protein EDB91DRAFT_573494 [Suillus paluster]